MPHNNEEFIGVDYGAARVGLARGSSAARLAEPLKSVSANDAIKEIIQLATINRLAGVVIGLPRNLQGDDTPQTKTVKLWVKNVQRHIRLPFYWQDEALTSAAAAADKAADIDSAAAAAILQDFLDRPQEERVRC